MEIGRNHPTNAERISKVRGRKNVFMLVKILGGQQFTEFERIAHVSEHLSYLFEGEGFMILVATLLL